MISAINVLSAHSLLSSFGVVGIAVVLFAETGLLVGLFLPGDSLLFTAGILSATSRQATLHLPVGWVIIAAAVGAILGAQFGYLLGRSGGRRMLTRADRPRLDQGVRRTSEFLDRYGVRKALVLARFVPVVRTAINPLAGVIAVPVRVFTLWQTLGGLLWTAGIVVAGWQLGSHISNIDHYLLPVVAVVVCVSLVPVIVEVVRSRHPRRAEAKANAR